MEVFSFSPSPVSLLQAGSVGARVGEGGGHRPGGWQCGKGWTTSIGSTSQLNQFRVIMKPQGSISLLFPAIFLLEVPIQALVSSCKINVDGGRDFYVLCSIQSSRWSPTLAELYRSISTSSSKSPAGRQLAGTGLGSFRKLQNRVNNNKQK